MEIGDTKKYNGKLYRCVKIGMGKAPSKRAATALRKRGYDAFITPSYGRGDFAVGGTYAVFSHAKNVDD